LVCPSSGVAVLESSSRTSLALQFGLALSINAAAAARGAAEEVPLNVAV